MCNLYCVSQCRESFFNEIKVESIYNHNLNAEERQNFEVNHIICFSRNDIYFFDNNINPLIMQKYINLMSMYATVIAALHAIYMAHNDGIQQKPNRQSNSLNRLVGAVAICNEKSWLQFSDSFFSKDIFVKNLKRIYFY